MTAFWQLPQDVRFAVNRSRLFIDDVDRTPVFDHGDRCCLGATTGCLVHAHVSRAGT